MSTGNGTGTERARKFDAVIWVPYRPKKRHRARAAHRQHAMRAMGAMGAMGAPPSTTSTIAATRQGAMVTLTYTLHAAQPMTYVIVTYNAGSGSHFVSEWSADLHQGASNDLYLPPTVAAIGNAPPQAIIEVRCNTAAQNGILAASTNV